MKRTITLHSDSFAIHACHHSSTQNGPTVTKCCLLVNHLQGVSVLGKSCDKLIEKMQPVWWSRRPVQQNVSFISWLILFLWNLGRHSGNFVPGRENPLYCLSKNQPNKRKQQIPHTKGPFLNGSFTCHFTACLYVCKRDSWKFWTWSTLGFHFCPLGRGFNISSLGVL